MNALARLNTREGPTLQLADKLEIRRLEQIASQRKRALWLRAHDDRATDGATLSGISTALKENFLNVLLDLKRRFGNEELRVLFEGCGFSVFPEELEMLGEKYGMAVRVFRTDLYSLDVFGQIAQNSFENSYLRERFNRDMKIADYFKSAPEELLEIFGSEFFHLVVSRSGGLTYTPLMRDIALFNVCEVLHFGGIAFIFSEDINQKRQPKGRAIRIENEEGNLTLEGEFLSSRTDIQTEYEEYFTQRGICVNLGSPKSKVTLRKTFRSTNNSLTIC